MMKSLEMLSVAKTALNMLEDVSDVDQVHVLWIAAISSLRAVGHVLNKADRKSHPEYAKQIDSMWDSINNNKNDNRIFFDFIKAERNDTLKEFKIKYDNRYHDSIAVITDDVATFINELTNDCIYIPMTDGIFEGKDIRELINEAIIWWEEQFNRFGIPI